MKKLNGKRKKVEGQKQAAFALQALSNVRLFSAAFVDRAFAGKRHDWSDSICVECGGVHVW